MARCLRQPPLRRGVPMHLSCGEAENRAHEKDSVLAPCRPCDRSSLRCVWLESYGSLCVDIPVDRKGHISGPPPPCAPLIEPPRGHRCDVIAVWQRHSSSPCSWRWSPGGVPAATTHLRPLSPWPRRAWMSPARISGRTSGLVSASPRRTPVMGRTSRPLCTGAACPREPRASP